MSQMPRRPSVLRSMDLMIEHDHTPVRSARADVRAQEEFELAVVGADLAALHAMKVARLSSSFEAVLRLMPKHGVVECSVHPLGRDPSQLVAQCERTPEQLAEIREAA